VDEGNLPGETARQYVLRLAEAKAREVVEQAPPGWVVVGADTAVVDQGEILGKPSDHAEAVEMLRRLGGRTHRVFTALALLSADGSRLSRALSVTDVTMRPYTDDEIGAYVATGDPLDKAGGYAIQHRGFQPVMELRGCYANVVGLPLCDLATLLTDFGVSVDGEIPEVCPPAKAYDCPVSRAVLRGEL
jgi:MAF protein